MFVKLQMFGHTCILVCSMLGRSCVFIARTFFHPTKFRRIFPLFIDEVYHLGVLSLPIILLSSLFIGMVLGLQGYNTLNKFGSTAQLGQLVALSIVRELGPVITGLLFAGRAGSSLTAEIGLMQTTEQISSMEMIGVDPHWRVVAPRLYAGIFCMPLLSIIFCALAIFGGYLVGVKWLNVDSGIFWSNMRDSVDFNVDILGGIIKSFTFGIVITWIAVFQGYNTQHTPDGVSIATTKTVVYSSLMVLILDFVLTAVMIGDW